MNNTVETITLILQGRGKTENGREDCYEYSFSEIMLKEITKIETQPDRFGKSS